MTTVRRLREVRPNGPPNQRPNTSRHGRCHGRRCTQRRGPNGVGQHIRRRSTGHFHRPPPNGASRHATDRPTKHHFRMRRRRGLPLSHARHFRRASLFNTFRGNTNRRQNSPRYKDRRHHSNGSHRRRLGFVSRRPFKHHSLPCQTRFHAKGHLFRLVHSQQRVNHTVPRIMLFNVRHIRIFPHTTKRFIFQRHRHQSTGHLRFSKRPRRILCHT